MLEARVASEGSGCQPSAFYFDEFAKRVCVIQNEEKTERLTITAKSFLPEEADLIFRVKHRSGIRGVSLSTDLQILAIQSDDFSVDFAFREGEGSGEAGVGLPVEAKHVCSSKISPLRGMRWVAERHLVLVGDECVELHHMNYGKRTLKCLRSYSLPVDWFTCYAPSQLILFSSGSSSSTMHPFLFQSGTATRPVHRFEVDFGCSKFKPRLTARDIMVASLYERICVLVLSYRADAAQVEAVNIYEFSTTEPLTGPKLTKVLRLRLDGLIGLQVVDNLVFVHHQSSQSSLLFDPFSASSRSPAPTHGKEGKFEVLEQLTSTSVVNVNPQQPPFYSTNTNLFPPNLVFYANTGVAAQMMLKLEQCASAIEDNEAALQFLLRRCHYTQHHHQAKQPSGESIFLDEFRRCLINRKISCKSATHIFHLILEGYQKDPTPKELYSQLLGEPFCPLKLDHNEIMRGIFEPLREDSQMDKQRLAQLVLEFFLVVKQLNFPMEHHYLPELVLKVLVDADQFGKLQQLLQYRTIPDSKFLAMELISLSERHPSLRQLAVDMFARRGNIEQITELLIAEGRLTEALKSLGDHTLTRMLCTKLLERAWATQDRVKKYTVFSYLANVLKLPLVDGSHEEFKKFITDFKELFSDEEIEEAERRFRLARISAIRSNSTSEIFDSDSETNIEHVEPNDEQQSISSVFGTPDI